MAYLDKFKKTKTFETEKQEIHLIELEKIQANAQVRTHINKEKLKELVDSIKERGLQSPIRIRPINDTEYVILTGERRWRAHKELGETHIKAIIVDCYEDIDEITIDQLVENIQRDDLNSIEKARGFLALKNMGKNQREIARSLGIRETDISKHLAILKKIPTNWLNKIEECCHKTTVPFYKINEIAQAKNKQKQKALLDKLLEEIKINIEEDIEEILEEEEKETKIKAGREYDVDVVWEAFKWVSKKDKAKLIDLIPPKTLDKILSIYESRQL